jgi:hypothetical protein
MLCALLAHAQPASDLLQTAIYNQDTLGDLNAAIRIYQQILHSGPGQRLYAAQAQFRLGLCLLRKGDRPGATDAFQTLIRDYPDQPQLVALARQNLPAGADLLRAPWSSTEVAEYRWTIPSVPDGWSISRIAPASDGAPNLRIQMSVYAPRPFVTQVDVDRNTMRPLRGTNRSPAERIIRFEYPAATGNPRYSYGELQYLLRRMPLALGWTTTLPLVWQQHPPIAFKAAVTGLDDVVVQAGHFKCFRVQLTAPDTHPNVFGADWPVGPAGEVLWIAVDGARPLVKIESGASKGELASLRTAEQIGTSSYRDPQVGYSFTVPAGWIFHPRGSYSPPGTSVDLLDPESQVWVVISAKPKRTDPDKIEAELMTGALEERARQVSAQDPPDPDPSRGTLTNGHVGGHASLSRITRHTRNGHTEVGYMTWIQSENTRASILVQVDAADFERFRQRFQPILDSFRMP